MREWINKIIDSYFKSFNNVDEGFSRKKMIALSVLIVSMAIEIKWAWKTQDFQQIENILMINFGFIGLLLGINGIEKIQLNKINSQNNNQNSEQK